MNRAIGGIFAAATMFAGGLAAFTPAASASGALYAVEAGDHGQGGWAGGSLFADGLAIGSGEIAPTPNGPIHITLTSWNNDSEPGYLDVNFSFGGVPGCVVLPVTYGAQQPSGLYAGGCDSTGGTRIDTLPGKATPTSH